MIILTGNSLGERQKDLNEKVNKAATDNAFDRYKTEPGNTDIDKIFLIDLAAKHKNIEFIVETLKSGDFVHITRALNKCVWLIDDEFANVFNVDNLHMNIFPLMSIKMKKKLLCMISINLKTPSRSIAFYEYCTKEGLFNIAIKFLFNTPEPYKNDVILHNPEPYCLVLRNKDESLANFIGNSFTLAEKVLDDVKIGQTRNEILILLRYMYSVSGEQYLSLLEKWYCFLEDHHHSYFWKRKPTRFGSRLSKEIIKKHKDNVLKNPLLYVNLLKKDIITKNSGISDVKVYAVSLLPFIASNFWDYNEKYKFILDIIPADERFSFMRKIFTEKYPGEEFEMSKQFHTHKLYNTMTAKEKENWALRHIASGKEMFGSGNDYKWYKFVSFDVAFEEIKKYVYITLDSAVRMKMINVLVDSAKTKNELETLLNYYYNRHVNELSNHKIQFLDYLIEKHDVLDFDENCWTALDKLFYSLNVYGTSNFIGANYREIALLYYILNKKTVPEAFKKLLESNMMSVTGISTCRKLAPEKENMVFQYLHNFYLTAIESLASKDDDKSLDRYINSYLALLDIYCKTKEDIAEIVNNIIKVNRQKFYHHIFLRETEKVVYSPPNVIHYLKKDATLVITEFPLIKQYIEHRNGRTNWLFQKLKIYFQHDIAKRYLQLLNDCLSIKDEDHLNFRMIQVAVYGIFKLADEPYKMEFMQKHLPTNPKIDHISISRDLLHIQKAICGYVCVSRPPLPLACVMQFLTGDYVHFSLPMFNYYLNNLPTPACITFVESIIDKPISIQKHGLRLAFQCLSTDNLKTLISGIWKRTKNISMRKILYTSLYDKVLKEKDQSQLELFEILNTFTLDLHENDDKDLFLLLRPSRMPIHLKGQHLVCGWKAVKKLPEKSVNFERMASIIQLIEGHITLVPEDEVITIVDDHVSKMLDDKEILFNIIDKNLEDLLKAKWELTFRYLANVYNEKQLKHNLEVVRHIIKRSLEMRDEVHKDTYIMRKFYTSFIKDLEAKSFYYLGIESYANMKIICDAILKDLQNALPEYEIFTLTLELRFSDITRNIILSCQQESDKKTDTINETVEAIRASLLKLAEAFVALINEYIDNGKYFAAFYRQIEAIIIKQLKRVNNKNTLKLRQEDLSILLSVGLLKFEIPEIYLLIIGLLPVHYIGNFDADYEDTISKVKAFKNTEVQYCMFEKFVNNHFMLRKRFTVKPPNFANDECVFWPPSQF